MPWVMRKRDFSISGGRAMSFRKVSSLQLTNPFGGFFGVGNGLEQEQEHVRILR